MRITEAVAKRIKTLLAEKEMTQYRLTQIIGMAHSQMTGIITAKNNSIDLKTILTICRGLEITASKFFDDPNFDDNIKGID